MKSFIKSLQLRWTDLAFVLGMIPFAVLLIFGQLFMQNPDPNNVAIPMWAAIICFIAMLGFWGYYLYEEVWKKRNEFSKLNSIVICTLVTLVLINIIAITIQPSLHVENVIVRMDYTINEVDYVVGQNVAVPLIISSFHKMFFIFELIAVALLIYIGLFVLPKRFTSVSFIKYLGYLFFGFAIVLIVYGYIAEFDKYIGFFKYVLKINRPEGATLYDFAVQSFILHRNAYGMMMMVAVTFSLICHEFTKKWYFYLLAAFFYINMIFSLCKTGLLISAISIFIYVIYRLIATYKNHKKRNQITLISIVSVVVVVGLLFGTAYITKGKVFGKIYTLVDSIIGGGKTLDTRTYIWDNSYQLMQNGWWVIGRGFGTFNTMLMPMNIVSHNDYVFPSHSSYIGLLAEGGILFLVAYLALLVYSGYVIFKSFKKQPGLTLTVSLGYLSFVLYSFIETIHYLAYVFLFPIMVIYFNSVKEKEVQ